MGTTTTAEDRAARAAYMREWRSRNLEACRVKERARREANLERERARGRESYARNREKVQVRTKAWAAANPWRALMLVKASAANRKYPGKVTGDDVAGVFERANRTCHWCGKKELTGRDLTLEHLKPINDVRHLVVACRACNSARILERGPRKSKAEQMERARVQSRRRQQGNKARRNERYRNRSVEARQRRRDYMREYMRKRRAALKES